MGAAVAAGGWKGGAMDARDVYDALEKRFSDRRRYAVAYEVGLSTGGSRRRLDMLVLDCYRSNGFRIDGIEVKASRADLRREIEDPDKHAAFFDLIDYYTLACPEGIADLSIIPPKWGVMTVGKDGRAKYLRRPLALRDEVAESVPRGFFAEVVRAIQGRDPGTQALEAEYARGVSDGGEAAMRRLDRMQARVLDEAAKLEAYDELERRFKLWGADPMDKLAMFERYMANHADLLPSKLRAWASQMESMADGLEGK